MNLTRINILEKEGISILFQNCQDLIRIIRLKEESFLNTLFSDTKPDFKTVRFMAEDLSGLYSSMMSLFHDFSRRVAVHFKDIAKTSEYLVVLSQVLRDKGVSVNMEDLRRLVTDSIDLYTAISDLLGWYYLFSSKYGRLLALITKHNEHTLGEEGFASNLKNIVQELIPWRDDLWGFVEEIYYKAQSIEKNYNYIISTYGLETRAEA